MATDYSKWSKIDKEIPDDEEDAARKRLRDLKEDMSDKEQRRLHDCWREPEFQKMFHDYAEEVSDPKHKAETEQYLAQCEAEQRAERYAAQGLDVSSLEGGLPGTSGGIKAPDGPPGSQLLKPHQGFVMKTYKRAPGRTEFDQVHGKVFINVCHHEEIDPPSSKAVTGPDGRLGESWSMPHLVSPKAKEEKDKSDHTCVVIDVAFHTDVLKRCDANGSMGERWKDMVAKTAIEMVGKLHELDLDPGFKILKMKYFGGAGEGPSTMAWKPDKAFADADDDAPKAKASPAAPSSAAPAGKPSSKPASRPEGGDSSSAPRSTSKPLPPKPAAPAKPKFRTPQHSVVHRGVGDMASAWGDSALQVSGRPRELLVKVELPELSSAADIALDIEERTFDLLHEGCGYKLHLPLPFPVLSDQGSAKFDKAKKLLSVTLPVAAEVAPPSKWSPASEGQTNAEFEAEERAAKAAEEEAKRAAEAEEAKQRAERQAERLRELEREATEREAKRQAAIARAEAEAAQRARAKGGTAVSASRPPTVPKAVAKAKGKAAGSGAAKPAEGSQAKAGEPKPVPAATDAAKAEKPAKAEKAPAPAVAEEASGAAADADWVVVAAEEGATSPPAGAPPQPSEAEAKAEAKPTGGGVPSFSNELLFELD